MVKPRFFKLLVAFGMVLGGFGAFYTLASSLPLFSSRDQFVAACREAGEQQAAAMSSLGSKEEVMHMFELQADARYSRRNVQLPLAAMNIILSLLLFAGCTRALRGQMWGLSAWTLAALASIPYTVLDVAFSIVQARDLSAAYRDLGTSVSMIFGSSLVLQTLMSMMKATLELLYFGTCLLYLRRPQITQLFSKSSPPAAH